MIFSCLSVKKGAKEERLLILMGAEMKAVREFIKK
jgi:hypothetical protein